MSQTAALKAAILARETSERRHRRLLKAGWFFSALFIAAFAIYGFDYYVLSASERPFSPKHALSFLSSVRVPENGAQFFNRFRSRR